MEYKVYYYDEHEKCIICKKESVIPDFENVNNKNNIIIDLNTKNVENIYDFFRNSVLESLLSNGEAIKIDYSDIENKSFYSDESFAKLILLINDLTEKSNKSIVDCLVESSV